MTAIAQDQASRNGHAASGRIVQAGDRRNTEGAHALVADRGPLVPDSLDWRLLDACRSDFPICERPFTEIARRLNGQSREVLRHFRRLERCGVVDRVGPVLAPEPTAATGTVVAMAVPKSRLRSITDAVMRHRGVSHMCERQHEFNLWFELTAPNAGELYDAVADIRQRTGVEVIDLRPERDYCRDLESRAWGRTLSGPCGVATETCGPTRHRQRGPSDRRLLEVVGEGLPIIVRPYAAVASRAGLSEVQVIERLKRLLRERVIERMGIVVRQDPPGGPGASALVAFDVSCHRVDIVGERLARLAWVNQCYRCLRRTPIWPYNLYCTLHDDRDLARLIGWVDEEVFGTVRCPQRTVLLSRARRALTSLRPA